MAPTTLDQEPTLSDKHEIEAVVQTYFDAMYESSVDKVHEAFHPAAMITGYSHGKLEQMSLEQFASFVARQQPSAKDKGDPAVIEIVSLEIDGDIAVARVRDLYLGLTFLDILSLLRVDGHWCIYNKLFHVEP